MGLLTPRKGAAPATGKVKPTRAEQLMAATQELAADQVPDAHTMTAIEGGVATPGAPATARDHNTVARDLPTSDAEHGTRAGAFSASAETPAVAPVEDVVRQVPVDAVRPSPFQPKGRPSAAAVDAVRRAAAEAGSLAALVAPEGAVLFGRLSPEAARLAELAADVAEHGVRVPVEVRTADNVPECLSGHRRLAAARLAGLGTVPALERGVLSNAAAAATVLRGNLHRENFTTWQEAVLVADVQERRRHDGFADNVRTLGAVMGWSHGKVNMLLRIRRALAPDLLAQAATQAGVPVVQFEEQLSRSAYRDLERLAAEPDVARRTESLNRLLGLVSALSAAARDRSVCSHRPKRGGGFLLDVNAPVEAMAASDASYLRELLEAQLTRVNARLAALGAPTE